MARTVVFSVGVHEPHEVALRIAGIRNRVTITVDGVLAIDSGGNLGIVMPNVFDLEIGWLEKHMVSVRLIAQQVIDGGAKYIDVFIDGRFAFRHDW
ncbi:hypothetical protein MUN76_02735 [Leucobacter rhizosphaerae]|uniref:Uncharacterized protein n=1 Tax=Leucobacter rhizosphaerae TaxID=2932245 RepID=A0ABY4FX96_9MICO|nr:hypothetical protein [Leucobacter rhizosphaerae]UOQ60915.1 hypothetical protein MUN76_02735 [Leucobacter rhizosphaerae]